ncbi:DUF3192 domain-containing protein [Pleionea sediminis]|uniref:DUF3192 domain-containing protein n=1 Tax=Pleionea sediminis TaxID=2569479 RepID=UPI0011850BAD|nr:DUF3192 domain-containing protein [Pleionea sediminis]
MRVVKLISAAVITSTLLSGCVIAIHDDEVQADSVWKTRQSENQKYINQLSLGRSITEVTEELGGADDSEGFEKDGKSYVVLYYRTRHRHSDGQTSRDETTPLIFENGKLIGWGSSVLPKYLNER